MTAVAVYWTAPSEATGSDADAALSRLDSTERARHERFRFERDRDSFALSHALVRRALSEHGEREPAAWRFDIGEHGRPVPSPESGIHFSLSHTAGALAVAVATVNVGVDVESVVTRGGTLELAEHYFAPPEAADVQARTGADKAARFFRYWTLKESYIKARSMGLAIPLDGFWFVGEGNRPRIEFDATMVDDEPARWHFLTASVAQDVPLALCTECDSVPSVSITHVPPEWFCA